MQRRSDTGRGTSVARLTKAFLRPEGLIGSLLATTILIMAIFGHLISPYDPSKLSLREKLLPPSRTHLFGTDTVGRDLLSRVLIGTRISLQSGLIVVILASIVGCVLGMVAGYFGGILETIIMRLTDMFVGFPALILAIAVAAALGPGLSHGVIAVSFVWWPGYARLARGQTLVLKPEGYVEAARASGCSSTYILARHILPNAIGPFIVKMTIDVGYAILYVAALGFLGLGAQPPTPEWGAMIAEAHTYTLAYPWYPLFPGLALFVVVVAFNLLGEVLQDAITVESAAFQ